MRLDPLVRIRVEQGTDVEEELSSEPADLGQPLGPQKKNPWQFPAPEIEGDWFLRMERVELLSTVTVLSMSLSLCILMMY